MKLLKIIYRNTFRHWLRSGLTILGLAITVMAFVIIRTTIDAWYTQAEAASPNRLITRHAVSLTFFLPLAYEQKIESVDGVADVSHATWFGGVYIEPQNFFAQFAVAPDNYIEMYPEFVVDSEAIDRWNTERNTAIVGVKLAERFGWKIGDRVQLTGTIFPGDWDFIIGGIYTGAKENTDENAFLFRWDYLDERLRKEAPMRSGYVGTFAIEIDDPDQAAAISERVDNLFKNSAYETRTETEEAFNLSFVAMASAIVNGLKAISIMVIGIVMLVLGNTMAMTARERVSEYAVMKTIGFRPVHIVGLIFGESLFMAVVGGAVGLAIAFPISKVIAIALSSFFPVFGIQVMTLGYALVAALVVGFLAAIFPTLKAIRTPIVDGLRIVD